MIAEDNTVSFKNSSSMELWILENDSRFQGKMYLHHRGEKTVVAKGQLTVSAALTLY